MLKINNITTKSSSLKRKIGNNIIITITGESEKYDITGSTTKIDGKTNDKNKNPIIYDFSLNYIDHTLIAKSHDNKGHRR